MLGLRRLGPGLADLAGQAFYADQLDVAFVKYVGHTRGDFPVSKIATLRRHGADPMVLTDGSTV